MSGSVKPKAWTVKKRNAFTQSAMRRTRQAILNFSSHLDEWVEQTYGKWLDRQAVQFKSNRGARETAKNQLKNDLMWAMYEAGWCFDRGQDILFQPDGDDGCRL